MTAQPAAEAYASHALSLPDCLAHGKRYRGVTLEQGIDYFVSRQDCGKTAFGWAMEDTDHIVKIIAEARSKIILGAHLIGPQASSMIRPL